MNFLGKEFEVLISRASKEDRDTVQNLARFYVYDMFRYCGFLTGWKAPTNGLFECIDLSSYFENPTYHPFLIQVNEELAGFVLVNKKGSSTDIDWNIGEFFIISKFQGKGIGRYVAEQIFDQFPGTWETSQIPENQPAVEFWEKVVSVYANGKYERNLKMIAEPKPHPMIVLKFVAQERDRQVKVGTKTLQLLDVSG